MLKLFLTASTTTAIALTALTSAAQAFTLTEGFTFSVANAGNNSPGNHFHSSTGGDFGNPAGKAEVGSFFNEEVRGLSEYNLSGLSSATSAFITFDIFAAKGLFQGENDFPFTGNIDIVAYAGNNLENISDFESPTIGNVATFSTTGLAVGNTLSFDITALFNGAISSGSTSLGLRLQTAPGTTTNGGAWTFDNFRLTTDNQTSQPVPEPLTIAGAVVAATSLGVMRRKQQKQS